MDPQIRNFRDFLQLYNKITELCFSHCANNFFNREISPDESACLDKCVQKFTRVNQRIMNVYVEVQSTINERRLAELEEAQVQQQQAQASTPAIESQPTVPATNEKSNNAESNIPQELEPANR